MAEPATSLSPSTDPVAEAAVRYLDRCRGAGDTRPALELLGEILSPFDARRVFGRVLDVLVVDPRD